MSEKNNLVIENEDGKAAEPKTEVDYKKKLEELEEKYNSMKKSFDKASSEVANYKKMYNEKLTDEEKQKQELEEKMQELEMLKNDKKKASIVNGLLSNGLSNDTASKIAESVLGGDVESIASALKDSYSEITKSLQDQIDELKRNSFNEPSGGGVGGEEQPKSLKDLTLDERIKLKQSNPELYQQLKNQ